MKICKTLSLVIIFLFSGAFQLLWAEDLRFELPSFTLTNVKFDLNISNLPTSPGTLSFKIMSNEKVILDGEKTVEDLKKIPLTFQESGKQQITVIAGDRKGSGSVRCLPGWVSILPPLVAIFLSFVTKEVLVSLFLGVWIGAFLINDFNPLVGFFRTVDKYLLEGLADPGHASIVIFSVTLGGMIGVVNRTGGMQGVVDVISRMVVGPKTAQLAAWIMGVVIFFDDYANTLIVGNSMRPITDKNRVSREKLSYIVDSTSAPVAGIALLSTWIGYEIGLIRQAFTDLNIPETNFYGVFLQTIPFRFYCVLTLFFGFVICLTKKEFGPMYEAEKRARLEGKPIADGANPISSPESAMPVLPTEMPKRWLNAAIPIAVVIFGTIVGLIYNGGGFAPHFDAIQVERTAFEKGKLEMVVDHIQSDVGLIIGSNGNGPVKIHYRDETMVEGKISSETQKTLGTLEKGNFIYVETSPVTISEVEKLRAAFSDANSSSVLIWVSALGSFVAILLGLLQGLVNLKTVMESWVSGARSMLLAMCVLLLAWSINGVCKDLHTAEYIVAAVRGVLTPWLLPALVFLISCLISFATGTSWGTMAIMLPISIPLAYHLNMDYYNAHLANQPGAIPMLEYIKGMLLVSIGAVLEGSIFGDHCSPISDTTIMSSMASGSDHIDHVKTQMPYAVACAVVSVLCCYIPAGLGFSPYLFILIGMITLVGILYAIGKDVPDCPDGLLVKGD